jgi:hypothetical protein
LVVVSQKSPQKILKNIKKFKLNKIETTKTLKKTKFEKIERIFNFLHPQANKLEQQNQLKPIHWKEKSTKKKFNNLTNF